MKTIFHDRDLLYTLTTHLSEGEISKLKLISRDINIRTEVNNRRKYDAVSLERLVELRIPDPVAILNDLKNIYGLNISAVRLVNVVKNIPAPTRNSISFIGLIFILLKQDTALFLKWIEFHGFEEIREKVQGNSKIENLLLHFAKNPKLFHAFGWHAKKTSDEPPYFIPFYKLTTHIIRHQMERMENDVVGLKRMRDAFQPAGYTRNIYRRNATIGGYIVAALFVTFLILNASFIAFPVFAAVPFFITGFELGSLMGGLLTIAAEAIKKIKSSYNVKRQMNAMIDKLPKKEQFLADMAQQKSFLDKLNFQKDMKAPFNHKVKSPVRKSSQRFFSSVVPKPAVQSSEMMRKPSSVR